MVAYLNITTYYLLSSLIFNTATCKTMYLRTMYDRCLSLNEKDIIAILLPLDLSHSDILAEAWP
jgi:hypothetical protein